jgi:hypothetical protein
VGRTPGSRNRESIVLEQRVAKLARKHTAAEIAAKVGRSVNGVYKILQRLGIRARSTRDQAPLANRTRVLKLVAKLGADGAAKKLRVSRTAIYERVNEWLREDGTAGVRRDGKDPAPDAR